MAYVIGVDPGYRSQGLCYFEWDLVGEGDPTKNEIKFVLGQYVGTAIHAMSQAFSDFERIVKSTPSSEIICGLEAPLLDKFMTGVPLIGLCYSFQLFLLSKKANFLSIPAIKVPSFLCSICSNGKGIAEEYAREFKVRLPRGKTFTTKTLSLGILRNLFPGVYEKICSQFSRSSWEHLADAFWYAYIAYRGFDRLIKRDFSVGNVFYSAPKSKKTRHKCPKKKVFYTGLLQRPEFCVVTSEKMKGLIGDPKFPQTEEES